jgi:hypothetical protein
MLKGTGPTGSGGARRADGVGLGKLGWGGEEGREEGGWREGKGREGEGEGEALA